MPELLVGKGKGKRVKGSKIGVYGCRKGVVHQWLSGTKYFPFTLSLTFLLCFVVGFVTPFVYGEDGANFWRDTA